jgi:hypothetical protein
VDFVHMRLGSDFPGFQRHDASHLCLAEGLSV